MIESLIFQREKFRELVVYLARKSAIDPQFSDAKLCRLLFLCDFEAYRRWGQAITGASYQKIENEPVPPELCSIRAELERDHSIGETDRGRDGLHRRVIVARRDAVLAGFRDDEIGLVDEIVHRLQEADGDQGSSIDHDFIGLLYARDAEQIPYETALLRPEPATASDIERAARLRSNGWLDFDSVR